MQQWHLCAFQFQTGSIKNSMPTWCLVLVVCFNSKLVRLEGELLKCAWNLHQYGFNSKLVRLEVNNLQIPRSEAHKFQFQTGSIRRNDFEKEEPKVRTSFNSKLVRLEVPDEFDGTYGIKSFNSKLVRLEVKPRPNYPFDFNVSIPNWCD